MRFKVFKSFFKINSKVYIGKRDKNSNKINIKMNANQET